MKKLFSLTLLGLFLISGSAFAAVTKAEGDIYADPYTVENSSGNWTLAGNHTVQGNQTITGNVTVSGTITAASGAVAGKKAVVVIAATPDTLSTTAAYNGNNSSITLARTGTTFLITGSGGVSGPIVLSLPGTNSTVLNVGGVGGAFTGEHYTFSCSTSQTIAIRTASGTDSTIYFGLNPGTTTRVTCAASSGSTIAVVGKGNVWYVTSMNIGVTNTGSTNGAGWTPGSF